MNADPDLIILSEKISLYFKMYKVWIKLRYSEIACVRICKNCKKNKANCKFFIFPKALYFINQKKYVSLNK